MAESWFYPYESTERNTSWAVLPSEENGHCVISGLPTYLSLPLTSREDLWISGYLEYTPATQTHSTFTMASISSPGFELLPNGTACDFALFHPYLEGENPGGGQGPPTSLPLPPTTREDLRLDGYLEYTMPERHYTFTNTRVFFGIRTQFLRHRSQCH
ncbi:hypothetical protein TNCV_3507071 [Trichonephila clavipes]|uniref:Uncharacterized protein n=1 Tax=Trichonephila clavipes TaxID=2585209 RepID=A0A8X6V326_TRICX|nr:hypothetical protein TNCV_3507071 [Trichonephila clavipes]